MENNEVFQNIDEYGNDTFTYIEEEKKEELSSVNAFVLSLPDWDLEPLYETVKRGEKK